MGLPEYESKFQAHAFLAENKLRTILVGLAQLGIQEAQILVQAHGVMMGQHEFLDARQLAKSNSVFHRAMAPTGFFRILNQGVLSIMKKQIGIYRQITPRNPTEICM